MMKFVIPIPGPMPGPLFCFLFGFGFALMLGSAAAKPDSAQSFSGSEVLEEKDFLEEVLRENLGIRLEKTAVEQARVDLEKASIELKPGLEWESRLDVTERDPVSFGREKRNTTQSHGLGLSQTLPGGGEAGLTHLRSSYQDASFDSSEDVTKLRFTQPLLRGLLKGSPKHYLYRLAALDRNLSETSLREKLIETLSESRALFWDYTLRLRQRETLVSDSAYWSSLEKQSALKRDLGLITNDEYLRIRINVLNSRQALLESKLLMENALAKLRDQINSPNPALVLLRPPDSLTYLPTLPDSLVALDQLRRNSPAIRRLLEREEGLHLSKVYRKNQALPLLNLHLEWQKDWQPRADARRVALEASYTFPNQARQDVKSAILALKANNLEQERTGNILKTSLHILRNQFQVDEESFHLAKEKLDLEKSRNTIARKRYELGELDFSELNLSHKEMVAAEQELFLYYVRLIQQEIDMDKLTGFALERFGLRMENTQ